MDGRERALRLLWLVFVVDQSGDLQRGRERGRDVEESREIESLPLVFKVLASARVLQSEKVNFLKLFHKINEAQQQIASNSILLFSGERTQ